MSEKEKMDVLSAIRSPYLFDVEILPDCGVVDCDRPASRVVVMVLQEDDDSGQSEIELSFLCQHCADVAHAGLAPARGAA